MPCRLPARVAAEPVEQDVAEAIRERVGVALGRQPGLGPVRRREREKRRRGVVEVGAELSELAALAEESPESLLVAPPLAEDLLAPFALEVAPLTREDRRDVELAGDRAQVRPQRETDLLVRGQVVWNRVEPCMESRGPVPHRLEEQVLLGVDPGVDGRLLDAERLREIADRRAVVALLGEEPRGLAGELGPAGGDTLSLTIVR